MFVKAAFLSILIAILGVGLIVFIRYRHVEITAAIMTTLVAELVLILGFASAVKWNIDLPSIAGILAIIGSGVDHQIIITDESFHRRGKKEELSLKQKLKRAFQIIFTAAATLTAAMLPIFFMAGIAASMKGFAFTTIVGVWLGVLVTRPAYSKIIEYILME
jgi:preprotein translocase subunit SecD